MKIVVEKSGGDFSSIQEAVNAVPYEESAEIHIGEGVFREKIFCEKKDITLVGEGVDKTVIVFDDYANEVMEDGSKRGTFRSYTVFLGGGRVHVKDMTIKNNAGDGRAVGQGIAVYADADVCFFENVKIVGCQDTLFCAPLPRQERKKNGFMGPRVLTERRLTRQYYRDCEIIGDVDFIFGGADAVFDRCTVTCNDRMHSGFTDEVSLTGSVISGTTARSGVAADGKTASEGSASGNISLDKDQIDTRERFINGYITAACGRKEDLGFVFRNCRIGGAPGCEDGSVFLGRPWRDEARTVFLDCEMDATIAPERFSGWGGIRVDQPETFCGEFGSRVVDAAGDYGAEMPGAALGGNDGSFADLSAKNSWVRDIDEAMAAELSRRADEVVRDCTER